MKNCKVVVITAILIKDHALGLSFLAKAAMLVGFIQLRVEIILSSENLKGTVGQQVSLAKHLLLEDCALVFAWKTE